MKRLTHYLSSVSLATLFVITMVACGGSTDVVESGIYQGTIDEVEADKTEIYVKTTDNKKLELYFTDQTELTKNGETINFDILKEGMKVEVEVEKVGQRLDPIAVKVLD
ncbi:hypothetical protein JMN32_20955 [Fulvivirga sp. 29W222]|uniref:DUF3221 domain-containing protein n=1 Tax=Fulvivirga marina TaxID=2494733 RepID=A0A937FZ20_9BACT|nr:hypothetical protein [Fulvivirga marina]MBL6448794.1 hypothetical protein [Fulvivirga marina]